ncbi:MAG: 3-deoxy-D-manno-octulosonic acid transferase, partial [Rhodobacteraceae bacterium]|nr:3-deoxy-D-manno-octulosonic acid transferase [Paracoccaceae bacterium]
SEIWPLTLDGTYRRQIPVAVINGRMSARSAARWKKASVFSRRLFNILELAIVQNQSDAETFKALGTRKIEVAGNLKSASAPLPDKEGERAALTSTIGQRRRWVAASIHPGEDRIIFRVHQSVRKQFSDLLTVVVPRHPDKMAEMVKAGKELGLNFAIRSRGDAITPSTDIYFSDTMGELGVFYRLCPIAYVGKSLAVGGGQNPIEPAQLGCAVLMGPDMSNFETEAGALVDSDGGQIVASEEGLYAALHRLLTDDGECARMGARAASTATANPKPLENTLAALQPYVQGRPID